MRGFSLVVVCGLSCVGCWGPPAVDSKEAFADTSGKTQAAAKESGLHAPFDALLKSVVRGPGVDYDALAKNPKPLDDYLVALESADFESLSRDGKLALLINAYNAFTLRLILDNYPLESIKDIADSERWKKSRWKLLGTTLSLDALEHEYLRAKFKEPRIHFAINCASVGCPPLRGEAYTAEKLESQLAEQTEQLHSQPTWFRYDAKSNSLQLTKLYDWFGGDFEQSAGSVLKFVSKYSPEVAKALEAGNEPSVSYMDYDWTLNRAPAK